MAYGPCTDTARRRARQCAHIPPYDDEWIIADLGTLGLELLEQVPDLDAALVPISGGSLVSGIAIAVKSLRPEVSVIGVEPEIADDAVRHLAIAGRLVAEPFGAVTTVDWFTQELPAGRTAALISGGSVDPAPLARILESPRL